MLRPLLLLNVVGLTHDMLGPNTPHLSRLAADGFSRPMGGVLPAVTCTAQATILTGTLPNEHGIVANGWYFRDLAEVLFWRQSNRLVVGERLYDAARWHESTYTVAKMFWWYNMYANVEWSMTPRPCYAADGRKIFDSYSQPPSLRDELQSKLGVFPLQRFWGPGADIRSSTWIADASVAVMKRFRPSLTLVYLPHLDYNLQRLGPNDPKIAEDLRLVDAEAGKCIAAARDIGAQIIALSEYAITPVSRPIHLNRILRRHGYVVARRERPGWETLDCGASRAFAVADHQVAHVYIERPEDVKAVKLLLNQTDGVDLVLDRTEQAQFGINHERSGELFVVAAEKAWFTYYFWEDDSLAPDYARTIDIHRKPGYDPMELFIDPNLPVPQARIAWRLAQKFLGFRYTMDVIGLDARIVKGSHGRLPTPGRESSEAPVFICSDRNYEQDEVPMTDVKNLAVHVQFQEFN